MPCSKLWRKWNHVSVMLVSAFMTASVCAGSAYAQTAKVNITGSDIPLKTVLAEIEKQTNYLFVYNNSEINLESRATLDTQEQSVRDVLSKALQNTGIGFRLEGNNIMLVKETAEQARSISGVVADETGYPLLGATVVVKGTQNGDITDADGNFNLAGVRTGNVLVINYSGYKTYEMTVGAGSRFSIAMQPDNQILDAVVVTALGIKRSEKALSYNVQEIGGDDINRFKDANLVNSLSGKVAGVTINASSSGVGGASKVVMRGTKSIEQSSNALYVIDGIPMFNLGGSGDTTHGSSGVTEAIADINSEDIESISILTGAAAAALYGSNAANGAIIVTTKRGSTDRTSVSVSSSTEFLSPLVLPEFQNRYGTGDMTVEAGSLIKSWGKKLNSYTYKGYDPRSDYFETGAVYSNAVSLSTGTAKNQTYLSAATVNSNGIIPNNQYDRYNFSFRNTSKFLKDKMTLDMGASYIIQKDLNMTNQGQYSNPITSAYLFPRGDDWNMVRVFERYDAARRVSTQYWPQGPGDFTMQNPYWTNYRNLRDNDKKRYMLNANLSYEILDWLSVTGRVRIDNSHNTHTEKLYSTTITTLSGANGQFGITKTDDKQTYADAMLNVNKNFGKFSLVALLGGSVSDVSSNSLNTSGPLRTDGIPNVFNVFNIIDEQKYTGQSGYREQTQSVFGSVEVGYKGMLYLSVTGRNDWASQLANSSNTSFFYPSVGLAAIISEMVKLPKEITYLKLRGSFSSVGTPYPRNLTTITYGWNNTTKEWPEFSHYPIYDLLPERTKSWEVGLTTRLFRKLHIDLSYYRASTYNQTFDPQLSATGGYSRIYMQTGNVRNAGIELSVGYDNRWNDWGWSTGFTMSHNKNKIIELVDGAINPATGDLVYIDRLDVGGLDRARFILKTGGSMGDLYGISDLKRDSRGNIYVDANGNVSTRTEGVSDIYLGSVFPKANLAWRNDVSWKNINLNFMISARLGGVVYSGTQAAMDWYGVSERSAAARDLGYVLVNGTDRVDPQVWYSTIGAQGGVASYYTYSATNVRLQELSLGYTIPRQWLGDICNITVSFVGRNLWMIYNKAPFDPEAVATTGNYYQGIDYFMVPGTRNIGFNIRLKF